MSHALTACHDVTQKKAGNTGPPLPKGIRHADHSVRTMLRYLKTLPISTRLWLLIGIFSLVVLVDNVSEMVLHGQRLRAEKEQQLEQLVETAHSILRYYEGESQAGRLSDDEARRQAIQAIRPLRYSEREYFWIHDLGQPVPRMVMHATVPALDGTILDTPDFLRATTSRPGAKGPYTPLPGINLFVAMNQVATSISGKGFVTYDWHKPLASGGITQERYPKLSFVKHFQPWGWVVGSGMYMDEFEATYWHEVQINIIKVALSLLLFSLMVWIILRTIIRPLHALQSAIDSLRSSPDHAVRLPVDQPQELDQLGHSFQTLIGELQDSRKALHASLDDLRLAGCAVTEMSEGVMVANAARVIVSVNPAFTRITGYTLAEAVGQAAGLLKSGRHNERFYQAMWYQLNASGAWAGEIWNCTKDGRIYPEWLSISTSRDARGQVLNYIGVFSDITERKQAESDLRIAATAFEAQEGMFITDAKGVILRVNQGFSEITGYTASEAIGKTPGLLSSGRHNEAFYAAMRARIEQAGAWQGEIWNRRKSGEIFPEWLTITVVKDEEGQVSHYVSTLTDITKRKAAENEIQHLAFYDPLTRLPNRRLLLDRLQHALSSSDRNEKTGALLFIDLDNFKTLNDTLGHDRGDLLLQGVAERLLASVRDGDTVARLGGDEFVVMLENLSSQEEEAGAQTKVIGEKILASLNQVYDLAGHNYHSSPSIGIALFRGHESSMEELLKRADLAMYQSKAAGRNTLRFFDPEMQSIVNTRAALEAELREAVRLHQFVLHYQPQVDGTGQPTGVEALIRWQHPQRGLVLPAEFIPLAEETGLILPMGLWVLETACRQLVAWAREPGHAHLCIAVNLSARQCKQGDFVAQVLAVLDQTGADPKKLKLELTESLLLDNVEGMVVKMMALKARGIGFALDDFGTGYSSLSYLKRLPLDQLKIDQSFVQDLLTDSNDAQIARTIITLAQSLGLAVIAEGVETQAQRDCLATQGCHHYQGYLFGRPAPAATFQTLPTHTPSTTP
jgi:diguanylate cyclase (GGDEF)-like protein/PAS domain S-box-containing protein